MSCDSVKQQNRRHCTEDRIINNDTQSRLAASLQQQGYVAENSLVSSLYLMGELGKPLLIEGEAGVGKTDCAKCLAAVFDANLIRLQCYEGLDAHHALYDWDYPRQLLAIQMARESEKSELKSLIYSDEFLLKRPLLAAISEDNPVVLLIDEIDRADEEFEALLLEVLSDFQVSIPELGTFTATSVPRVILTSNGTRELSDALRRRCLYHYIGFPDADKELRIIRARLPDIDGQLASQIVTFVQNLRQQVLRKTPGVAESLDWARALLKLGVSDLSHEPDVVASTLTCLIKTRDDLDFLNSEHPDLASFM